jgi:hypothetical protein
MLADKASLEKIGVTDEALSTKILAELKPLKEQGDVLEKKIREISREQAQLMRGLLNDKASDPKPAMDKIDEVAKLRAEQEAQAEKERIDEILDKISKSGYDALSKEEKDLLFHYSQK